MNTRDAGKDDVPTRRANDASHTQSVRRIAAFVLALLLGGLVPTPTSSGRILFIEEVSLSIGKTATTIRTCATNEKYFHLIPRPFKLPSSRRLLWREEDVQAWINQATTVGQVKRRRGAPTKAERVAKEKAVQHG